MGETGGAQQDQSAGRAELHGFNFLKRLSLGSKLTVGFAILVTLTLIVVALNYAGSINAVRNINRTSDLRAPSALASARAQANLLRMLSEVRGYLALGDEVFKNNYEAASQAFQADLAELEKLLGTSVSGGPPQASKRRLDEFKVALADWQDLPQRLFNLRADQLRREPALRILIAEANPVIVSIVVGMKAVMTTQQHAPPSAASIALLAEMSNFQSSFYAMIAGLRGYVTTKREMFKYEYESNLAINDAAWGKLVHERDSLQPSQLPKLDKVASDREKFMTLPPRMFEAVEGEHAREDLYLFRTEAVPLAERMLKLLDDIATGEQSFLQSDLSQGRDELASAQRAILIGGAAAVLLGSLLAFTLRSTIVGPVRRLTATTERVRGGDLSARAQVESEDEIGHLAVSFNEMTTELGNSLADLERRRKKEEEAARTFRRQSEYLGALHETGLGLMSRLDLAELLSDLITRAGKLLGTEHGYLYLVDPDGAAIERHVGVGAYSATVGQKLGPNEGVAGRVWQSGEALVINDYESWEGRPAAATALEVTIRAVMGVPLTSSTGTIGVLGMAYDAASNLIFGQNEVELLGRFAQLASISLDNARLYAAAQEAKLRAETANQQVTEQNRVLHSLSNQLSKYLSPQVYSSIFTGQQSVEISSRRKKLTIFFSDIGDFTETTDSLESEELTGLLNRYLTEMSKIALEHGATVDKYIGDAIMAFFGDPETKGVKEDALACVKMAIAMQQRMQSLQSEWMDRGIERPFQLRIGINTGFCTVGNFGSEDRMDYTLIGSEVNLASRLQSHADLGGILIAHETHSLVKDAVVTQELEPVRAKGFAKPIRTYRVLGIRQEGADSGTTLHHQQQGISITLDLADMTAQSKAAAVQVVEEILARLKR
jgi:class 3 adenylate cyclase/CHASE3 domain sensor protein